MANLEIKKIQEESGIVRIQDPAIIEQLNAKRSLLDSFNTNTIAPHQGENSYFEIETVDENDPFGYNVTNQQQFVNPQQMVNPQNQNYNINYNNNFYQQPQPVKQVNPHFVGIKKSVDFNTVLKIQSKIPSLNFIKMLEESLEESYVDFLTETLFDELLADKEAIKVAIKNELLKVLDMLPPVQENKQVKPKATARKQTNPTNSTNTTKRSRTTNKSKSNE